MLSHGFQGAWNDPALLNKCEFFRNGFSKQRRQDSSYLSRYMLLLHTSADLTETNNTTSPHLWTEPPWDLPAGRSWGQYGRHSTDTHPSQSPD